MHAILREFDRDDNGYITAVEITHSIDQLVHAPYCQGINRNLKVQGKLQILVELGKIDTHSYSLVKWKSL